MYFKAAKDTWFGLCILLLIVMVIMPVKAIMHHDPRTGWMYVTLSVIPVLLLPWIWFGTSYRIAGNKITYRCGPFSGNVPVDRIHTIELGKTLKSGIRPALSLRGMVIFYDRYNELYIAPEDYEAFTNELLKINSGIKITGSLPD